MGFKLEYLSEGTVKGTLDLRDEMSSDRCTELPMKEKNASVTSEKLEKDVQPPEEVT